VEVESSENIRRDVKTRYNKNPRNWQFLVGRDESNYLNSVILHGKDMWIIKEEAINPYKSLGLGVKTKIDRNFKPSPYSFGLRPISHDLEMEILGGDIPAAVEIIEKILRKKPVSYDKVGKENLILQGPVISQEKPITFSKAQQELDRKLRKSLRDLIYKKRPDLMTPYV